MLALDQHLCSGHFHASTGKNDGCNSSELVIAADGDTPTPLFSVLSRLRSLCAYTDIIGASS